MIWHRCLNVTAENTPSITEKKIRIRGARWRWNIFHGIRDVVVKELGQNFYVSQLMKYVAYGMQLLYGAYIICSRNVETVIHEGLQYETSFIEYEKVWPAQWTFFWSSNSHADKRRSVALHSKTGVIEPFIIKA